MSAPQPIQNDIGGNYLAYRTQIPESTAGDALLKEMGGSETPKPAGTPQAPSGAPQPSSAQGNLAWRATKDVVGGAVESPRGIYTGARDAVVNTYDALDDFSKWASTKLSHATGFYGVKFDKSGVHLQTASDVGDKNTLSGQITGGQGTVPQLGDMARSFVDRTKLDPTNMVTGAPMENPKTTTGALVKGVAQFLTGLALTRGSMKAVGLPTAASGAAGYGLSALQGAAANFAAFDPHQQRLSNLIEKFPELSNPVTQYLSSQPGDSDAEGRFKNALEGTGLGALTDGFMKAVRLMRGLADAKAAAPAQPATEPGVPENAFRGLGDASPEAPLVSDKPFSGPPTPEAPAPGKNPLGNYLRGQHAEAVTAGVTPEEVIGQHIEPRPPEGRIAPMNNHLTTLSDYTPAVYRETSPDQLGTLLPTGRTQDGDAVREMFVADTPEMALGQGENQGVRFQFDASKIKGQISTDKPTWQNAFENGAGEYVARNNSQESWKNALQGVTLSKEAQANLKPRDSSAIANLLQTGWRRIENADGSVTYSKSQYGKPVPPVTSTAEGAAREPAKNFINFAKIDTPEDVQNVMQTLADRFKGNVDSARRGTQTFEQIKLNSQMENAWDLLQNRRTGEPLNAEQSVAARELWASSADKLKELAQTAVAAPTEENLFSFRKMMATHYAIQSEVMGARTETARALASWRIPVGSSASRLQDITDRMMTMSGGMDNVRDMAQKVSAIADSHPYETEQFIQKSAYERTRDGLVQAFRDGLLSSPVTQTRILASNVTTGLWRIGERAWASKISQAIGTPNGVSPGEAGAMWSGWIGGFKNSMAFAGKAFKTGVTGEGIGEPHEPYPSNISAEAFNLKPDGMLGRSADFIGNALSLGRRGIATQHDMALTAAYSAEKNAQAVRQATQEMNSGELEPGKFNSRVSDLLANPPPSLDQASKAGAKYQSFLDEPGNDTIGKLTNWMLEGRKEIPALNILAPFIKIPSRIMSYTFERSPLAPMMSDWRSKVAAGGATRDLALAQASMGTGIFLSAADMTMNGMLKGGGPPQKGLEQAQEREGAMRDSMKVGNRWYNINGVHPIGKLMLLAADVAEAITGGQQELHQNADTEKLAVGTALAIGRTLVDNSYFQGFANLFATLHDARVGGAGEGALLSTAGSTVPAISGATARALDPYQREVYSMLDEFKSKIPGLSNTLPPRRNLWGEPIPSGHDPVTNFLSPVKMADEKHEPIDDEILKQGFNITMPDRQQTFKEGNTSVPIDMSKYPAAYSRLLELSGNELKHPAWNMGLKDLLNSIVGGNHALSAVYNLKSDGPEGGKEVMIRDLISQYRDLAKKQVLDEYPAIGQEVGDKADAKRALKFGGMQ